VALPRARFETWNFLTALWVYLAVSVATVVLFSSMGVVPIEYNPDFDWTVLLPVALIGMVGILIQAGSEELLFRGYLTQFFRRFTSNPYVFIGIPALLFALPHIANVSELGGDLLVATPYLISGLLYAWAAWRTGSLWMALGLHWSNNYTSLVLMGTKGDVLPSAAPFQIEVSGLAVVTLLVAVQALTIVFLLNYLIKQREARR
jgi:membrane protease YdiL (CAAX protease family)